MVCVSYRIRGRLEGKGPSRWEMTHFYSFITSPFSLLDAYTTLILSACLICSEHI